MADEEDNDQKTEDPTAKRLSEARQQGNIPLSRDLATWSLLLGVVIAVAALFPAMTQQMMGPLTALLEKSGELRVEDNGYVGILSNILSSFGPPVLFILCVLLLMGVIGWLVQTGLFFSLSLFKLKWERLNPMEGVKRLFSANSVVELLKSVGKIIVVGSVALILIMPIYHNSESMTGMENIAMVRMTYDLSSHIIFSVFLVFSILAGIDLIYQRFTYFKNMRMSKQEVKEEFRQSEGDPHVKSRLRQIRTEKARKRMMAAVPKADVVITNPTHFAVALKYEAGSMQAPVMLAKGQDLIALKIREIADANKIPIVSNPPLARVLYATVEIDEEVPPEHYRAVAEVISYVYRLKNIRSPQHKK